MCVTGPGTPGPADDSGTADLSANQGVTQEQQGCRLAIDFAVDGDIRFLAHRDMLRLFARAVVRARLPIRYSEGFNPHPRLSLPLPRPVGVSSDAERVVVELTSSVDPTEALQRLQAQMPQGIRLERTETLAGRRPPQAVRVRYRVNIPPTDPADAAARAASLLGSDPIPFQRKNPKTGASKSMDLRPFLEDLTVDADAIQMTFRVEKGATVRPVDLLEVLGMPAEHVNHRVHRLEIEWQK